MISTKSASIILKEVGLDRFVTIGGNIYNQELRSLILKSPYKYFCKWQDNPNSKYILSFKEPETENQFRKLRKKFLHVKRCLEQEELAYYRNAQSLQVLNSVKKQLEREAEILKRFVGTIALLKEAVSLYKNSGEENRYLQQVILYQLESKRIYLDFRLLQAEIKEQDFNVLLQGIQGNHLYKILGIRPRYELDSLGTYYATIQTEIEAGRILIDKEFDFSPLQSKIVRLLEQVPGRLFEDVRVEADE